MAPMALVLFVNWESPACKPRMHQRARNGEKHWAVAELFWQDVLMFPLTFNPTSFTCLEIH